jgi:D-xylose transport system substrate-binding protein
MVRTRRVVVAIASVAALTFAMVGCSSSAATPTAKPCVVGVSWNNYNEERWAKWDEPAIKSALTAAGCSYVSNDAKSSADTQLANVDALVNQGASVVIILAQDGTAIKPAVKKALDAGVPVIAYDRLIEDTGAFYITFDNVLVGKMQAEALLKVKSSGNFVVIKGNKADANADFLLTANSNKIDIAFVENDGMAGGVVAALQSQGLAGTVPVSGQDGDAAALNRVALGTQTVDVWKDARMLGDAAGQVAAQLAKGTALDKITTSKYGNAIVFDSPGGNKLNSILLTPDAITKDNLKDVLDAGWIDQATLCKDVPAGTVDVCG